MGAPTGALLKIILRGHLTTEQTWSLGMFAEVTASGAVDCDAAAAALLADASTWANAIKGYWSTDTKWEGINTAFYPGGTTVATRTGRADASSPVVGVGSTLLMPTYVAACHTLKTNFSGRSYRGRVYVPVTNIGLAAQGQMDSSTCTAFANALKSLIQAYNAVDLSGAGLTGNLICVASFTKGLTTLVSHVQVDSKMDVQHRREDKIGAAHTALVAI